MFFMFFLLSGSDLDYDEDDDEDLHDDKDGDW